MSDAVAQAAAFEVPGYTLGERIGAGGFGEVYRAKHALMGRNVAIKVLNAKYSADPEAVARFVSEARAVARISHPGIVDVFDFGQLPDGRQYCVMELVRGTTLRDLLKERSRLPLAEALPILRGIAEAIDAAHAAGIAHRDLKPDNVFVLDGGGIKLIDFGLAKLTADEAPPVTQTGSVFGTPLYMSPEQCRGKATDTRTDAYSFGVLAYHVLVGAPPFTGEALEIALHHLNDPPEPPSVRCEELDDKVDRVVLALMAKDPARRPPNLVTAIAAIAGEAALPEVIALPAARRRWPYVVLGVAAAGGIAAFAISRAQSSGAETGPAPAASCTPAAEKLAGVWDAARRAELEARFTAVKRPDIPGTWRALSSELDAYAGAWSTQWEAACTQDATDPALHAQRTACLDFALVDLTGMTAALAKVDATAFATSWSGGLLHATLASCATESTLRAQPPPAPAGNRDAIVKVVTAMHAARLQAEAAVASGQLTETDRLLSTFDQLGNQLQELKSPAESVARWHRALYFAELAELDPPRRESARLAIRQVIDRVDAARDDHWLALGYALLARFEVEAGALDAAEDAKTRADTAYSRGGNPVQARRYVILVAQRIRAARGAISLALTKLAAIPPRDFGGADTETADRAILLRRADRAAEALALLRTEVAERVTRYGEQHALTADARVLLAAELEQIGDVTGALDEVTRAIAVQRTLGLSPVRTMPVRARQLDLAIRAGRTELVEEAAAASLPEGARAPLAPAQWLAVTQAAFERGAIETAHVALARVPADAGAVTPMRDELSAILAAIDGDVATLERDAHEAAAPLTEKSPLTELRLSLWLRGLGEIARGNRAAAEARLARFAAVRKSQDPNVVNRFLQGDGLVLVGLGKYRDAVAAFVQVRGMFNAPRTHGLAAADAWLGVTRVAAGDLRGAVVPLEEALDVFARCCSGYSWLAPGVELSLARALWDTGRDRRRARRLAELARDHYVRFGRRSVLVFPDLTAEGAEAWLAAHTAELAEQPVVLASGCPWPKDPTASGKHALYLATEGVSITRAQLPDSRKNASALLPVDKIDVPPFLDGVPERTTRIAGIQKLVQATLAPYSIDVVVTRPTSGDYWMTVIGGTPKMLQGQAGTISFAPFDCTANVVNNISFAFDYSTAPKDAEYARTILSDFGAMIGLTNVEEEGDCMCRSGRMCEFQPDRVCTFGAAGVLPVTNGQCNRKQQDESAMLKAALGCR